MERSRPLKEVEVSEIQVREQDQYYNSLYHLDSGHYMDISISF